jgi:hypothetical protein
MGRKLLVTLVGTIRVISASSNTIIASNYVLEFEVAALGFGTRIFRYPFCIGISSLVLFSYKYTVRGVPSGVTSYISATFTVKPCMCTCTYETMRPSPRLLVLQSACNSYFYIIVHTG